MIVGALVRWGAASAGLRLLYIYRNSHLVARVGQPSVASPEMPFQSVTAEIAVAVGDELKVTVYQDSGAGLIIAASDASTSQDACEFVGTLVSET